MESKEFQFEEYKRRNKPISKRKRIWASSRGGTCVSGDDKGAIDFYLSVCVPSFIFHNINNIRDRHCRYSTGDYWGSVFIPKADKCFINR